MLTELRYADCIPNLCSGMIKLGTCTYVLNFASLLNSDK